MVSGTISRLNVLISAQDRASSVIGRVQNRLNNLSKEGLAMGATFAAVTMGIGTLSTALQNLSNFIKESVDKFYEFDRAITEVATMLDKTETRYIPELEKGIERISIAFGQSAIDVTRALYQALSAGIQVTDSLKFMWEASKLAKTGLADLETTVDVLTTVMNAYGMSALQVSRISDIMMATVVMGKLRLQDLATSLGYVVPVAAQAGVSFEEISAAMATMTKQGINAQIASRGLRQLITNLIAPSEGAKDAMVELGVAYDEWTLRARGLQGVIELINEATGGSVSKINELIPNVRALSAQLALCAEDGNLFAETLEYIENSLGLVNEKFKEITKSAAYQRDVVVASMEAMKRKIGEAWQPYTLAFEAAKLAMIRGGWKIAIPFVGPMMAKRDIEETIKDIVMAGEEAKRAFELDVQRQQVEEFAARLEQLKLIAEESDETIRGLRIELEKLPKEIEELNIQLGRMQEARRYQLALRYIPYALKSASYASRIFDERVRALVDSIRIQRREIDRLSHANQIYSMQQTKNNLEMMKIQLAASYRRGRMTREEKARMKELERANLELRIAETTNQLEIDKIRAGGLKKEEERLELIKMEYQDRLFTIMDTYEEDVKKMEEMIQYKKILLETHRTDLEIALDKSRELWEAYYRNLSLYTAQWSVEMIKYYEKVTGYSRDVAFQIAEARLRALGVPFPVSPVAKKPVEALEAPPPFPRIWRPILAKTTKVEVAPITVNANIKTELDLLKMGGIFGRLLDAGVIKGATSEFEVG